MLCLLVNNLRVFCNLIPVSRSKVIPFCPQKFDILESCQKVLKSLKVKLSKLHFQKLRYPTTSTGYFRKCICFLQQFHCYCCFKFRAMLPFDISVRISHNFTPLLLLQLYLNYLSEIMGKVYKFNYRLVRA